MNNKPPKWAIEMMKNFDVSGWRLGHPYWWNREKEKFKCLSCGEIMAKNLPPCYGKYV